MKSLAEKMIGEKVVTNDRVLNYVLKQMVGIIERRDVAPVKKLDLLYSYMLKVRREQLGKID